MRAIPTHDGKLGMFDTSHGVVLVVIVWWLVLQLPMLSMPITTKVVCLNPAHGEVYSMQHYVIKFFQCLAVDRWFSPGKPVSSSNKTYHHDITEILLKVALNTITLTIAHTISCAITCQAKKQIQIPVLNVQLEIPPFPLGADIIE